MTQFSNQHVGEIQYTINQVVLNPQFTYDIPYSWLLYWSRLVHRTKSQNDIGRVRHMYNTYMYGIVEAMTDAGLNDESHTVR